MLDISKEMRDYSISPMPVTDFLDKFFPKNLLQTPCGVKAFKERCFAQFISHTCEVEANHLWVSWYDHHPKLIIGIHWMLQVNTATPFATSLEFINLSTHTDCSEQSNLSSNIKPDISMYAKGSQHWGLTDISCAELMIEFKWNKSDDPFCNLYILPNHNHKWSFLCPSKACADTLGQITLYIAAQLGSQFCTCIYSILVVKDLA